MRRRVFLGLTGALAPGLAGCTASALSSLHEPGGDETDDCPSLLDVDRSVCPGDDAPISVERSGTTVSGDAWSLVVTVTNRTAEPVGFNPYAWSVLRAAEGGWEPVAPDAHTEPWRELQPQSRYTWQLTAGQVGLKEVDQRVFLDLPAGRYAFAVPVRTTERLGAVAAFEVTS